MDDENLFDESDSLYQSDIDINDSTTLVGYIPNSLKELFDINLSSYSDIKSLQENIASFRALRGYKYLYRGHSNNYFKLCPSIVRDNTTINLEKEQDIYNAFVIKAKQLQYDDYKPQTSSEDLYYMGIARHLGLKCRLLDWSAGINEALSFLLADNQDQDGTLWIMAIPNDYTFEYSSPFQINDDKIHILKCDFFIPDNKVFYDSPLGIIRRSKQSGLFSITSSVLLTTPLNMLSKESLNGIELFSLFISKETKQALIGCPYISTIENLYHSNDDDDELLEYVNYLNNKIL